MIARREDELRENFATLAAVLDGKGHLTASGVHGTRGYDGKYVFNWLGATTPVPSKTDAVMAQLGNRLLRYEVIGKEQSEDELLEFAGRYEPELEEDECRTAANDYFVAHFSAHPVNSLELQSIDIPKEELREIVHFAKLIAQGRVEVSTSKNASALDEEEYVAGLPEGPFRIIVYLRTIAQGLALVEGRSQVTRDDIQILRHVAFSSVTHTRRQVLRAVLVCGGTLDSKIAEQILQVSRPTARNRMKELAATGIVSWRKGEGNAPDMIALKEDWLWLLPPAGSTTDEPSTTSDAAEAEAIAA